MSDKGKGNQNAITHGVFSSVTILPGEDPEEFESLFQQVRAEWQPNGIVEEDAALDIARGIWLKRRHANYCNEKIRGSAANTSKNKLAIELLEREPPPFAENRDEARRRPVKPWNTREMPRSGRCKDAVTNLLGFSEHLYGDSPPSVTTLLIKMLPEPYRTHLLENVPLANFKSIRDWAFALKQEVDMVLLPQAREALRSTVVLPEPEAVASLKTPESTLQEMNYIERINAMIEKAIRRMLNAKMAKQMTVPVRDIEPKKQIELQSQDPQLRV